MLGINDGFMPKFVKKYVDIAALAAQGLNEYIKEVQDGSFPAKEHEYK
jgi:3-methyl-2-oxobutanoate hydroxymethyltransferase